MFGVWDHPWLFYQIHIVTAYSNTCRNSKGHARAWRPTIAFFLFPENEKLIVNYLSFIIYLYNYTKYILFFCYVMLSASSCDSYMLFRYIITILVENILSAPKVQHIKKHRNYNLIDQQRLIHQHFYFLIFWACQQPQFLKAYYVSNIITRFESCCSRIWFFFLLCSWQLLWKWFSFTDILKNN